MLPNLRSHKEYIKFVQQNLNDDNIPKAHDEVSGKLKLFDLTPIRLLALPIYKNSGRPADGTKLKAHSNPHGKKVCICQTDSSNSTSHHCECKRFYNANEASWGYDSYRDCYVFGYNLYQVNSWSFDNNAELPAYLMMATAARQDSVSGMYACQRITLI